MAPALALWVPDPIAQQTHLQTRLRHPNFSILLQSAIADEVLHLVQYRDISGWLRLLHFGYQIQSPSRHTSRQDYDIRIFQSFFNQRSQMRFFISCNTEIFRDGSGSCTLGTRSNRPADTPPDKITTSEFFNPSSISDRR